MTFEEWWTQNGRAYTTPFNAARDAWFGGQYEVNAAWAMAEANRPTEAVEQDAARYRWLREHPGAANPTLVWPTKWVTVEEMEKVYPPSSSAPEERNGKS